MQKTKRICVDENGDRMNSLDIQESVYQWATTKNFTAPYGVLMGGYVNAKGKKCKSVTFGHARTLDVEVKIFNGKFMIVRTSNDQQSRVFNDYSSLMIFLETLV
jgi:hypothetical protein